MDTNVSTTTRNSHCVFYYVGFSLNFMFDLLCSCSVLLVSRVSSGATVHSRKSPAHTAGEKKASEATIYSQKVQINASESLIDCVRTPWSVEPKITLLTYLVSHHCQSQDLVILRTMGRKQERWWGGGAGEHLN